MKVRSFIDTNNQKKDLELENEILWSELKKALKKKQLKQLRESIPGLKHDLKTQRVEKQEQDKKKKLDEIKKARKKWKKEQRQAREAKAKLEALKRDNQKS